MKYLPDTISTLTRREWLVICFLIITTLSIYSQMWDQEFINLDDEVYVTENPHVLEGLTPESVIWAFTNTRQVLQWIPLTWLTLMMDHDLYGLHAGGFKITNLLLHLVNSLLLLLLLRKMTGRFWPSAFVSALFAVHPLHVESVAWVTERKDVLSTLFGLLTIWSYLAYLAAPGKGRYILTMLAFALGLMAKPMVITLPFALLLLDYWPLNRFAFFFNCTDDASGKSKISRQVWRILAEKIPFLLLALAATWINIMAVRNAQSMLSLEALPFDVRLTNALVSYAAYIGKTIWPLNLGVLYPHPGTIPPWWKTAGATLVLLTISLAVLKHIRRYPYLFTGWFWFLGTLFPVIGFLQTGVQSMADRFIYIPSIGLFIMAAWGVPDLLAKTSHHRRILAVISGVVLAGAAALTWKQVGYWQNNFTLYEHTIAITDKNLTLQNSLGAALLKQNKLAAAERSFREALRIASDYEDARNNLGYTLLRQGRHGEAAQHFRETLRINPDSAVALNNLGFTSAEQGILDEAMKFYTRALDIKPDYAEAHNNLGLLLQSQGRGRDALRHFSEAVRLNPDFFGAHNNRGNTLSDLGRIDEAARHFLKAVELAPDSAEAHYNLGNVLLKKGDFQEAARQFSVVARLEPDNADTLNNLGIALAQLGRLKEAEQVFSKAYSLDPSSESIKSNMERAREQLMNQ